MPIQAPTVSGLFGRITSFCKLSILLLPLHPAVAQHHLAPTVWNASLTDTQPLGFELFRRDYQCAPGQPCTNDACCNGQTGICGLDPEHCDKSVCISNCDAKAECGSNAAVPGSTCPLNVCCSHWGYCGTTSEFCDTTGPNPCQSNCVQPPATSLSTGKVTNLVIGYFEAWAPSATGCSKRDIRYIQEIAGSLSHLYVAFGSMAPDTYEITPMNGISISIISQIMGLKENAPGLRIYLSLGGWSYSDNGTATQAVWGDLSSTAEKRNKFIDQLAKFMRTWGFDGVDLDWEYPGAPDRGGMERDIPNYVSLLQDIRTRWDGMANGWGLSFTAPSSYWYMRWFDIGNLTAAADWVNLLTYDLHGSWDSPEDQIGSFVYAHTNLTEISDAFDLLWRNNVPANKVNMGIGFYGRTFTLADRSCTSPGCPFSAAGNQGPCTQQPGILSYKEISDIRSQYNLVIVDDKVAEVDYFTYDKNQWVSYDDVDTLKAKIDYANKNGLQGIFIWAVDQDDDTHSALAAVLDSVGGLGYFDKQNGVGLYGPGVNTTEWRPATGTCYMGACGTNPGCPVGATAVGPAVLCDAQSDGTKLRRRVCCPYENAPSGLTCEWVGSSSPHYPICGASCGTGFIQIADNDWYVVNNDDAYCFTGNARYCCKASEYAEQSCGANKGACINIGNNGQPATQEDDDRACPIGRNFFTYSQGSCPHGKWMPWCCDPNTDTSGCSWQGSSGDYISENSCDNSDSCPSNYVNLGVSEKGGGSDCIWDEFYPFNGYQPSAKKRALCCPAGNLGGYFEKTPVPYEFLFPDPPASTESATVQLSIDTTDQGNNANGSEDPNENGFGWVIMVGPSSQLTSMRKRDGSHWELYDCGDNSHSGTRTVKAVCTDESESSNCNIIFKGGVERTVIEVPAECGPGRYAMAVSMSESVDHTLPEEMAHRLVKRGLLEPRVYDLTFDYDFSVIQGRDDNDVDIRIDFSTDPYYWSSVVDAPARRKRDVELRVRHEYGGNWKRYAHDVFHEDRHNTPEEDLHLLRKRWFSADLKMWFDKQLDVNEQWTAATHTVQDDFRVYFFDDRIDCSFGGLPVQGYFAAYADLNVNVQTSAQLTLIGKLNNLRSFQESHLLTRSKGNIDAMLVFDAFGKISFSTGRLEIFGAQNFGATFIIPGLVTVGPNFKVYGQLAGQLTLHTTAQATYNLAHWDYTQRYPNANNDRGGASTDTSATMQTSMSDNKFEWHADVSVAGDVKATISPLVEFGVVFASTLGIPSASVLLELDAYATLYGNAGGGSDSSPEVCYGGEAGANLFAAINAPTLFSVSLSQNWPLASGNYSFIPYTCVPLTDLFNTTCKAC
ncbi:carbohydrate-binding module family 18 [Xylaria sp. FL0933]|nr:carbohydrate-binding module family 18 [Xylaria sp. FL0933]